MRTDTATNKNVTQTTTIDDTISLYSLVDALLSAIYDEAAAEIKRLTALIQRCIEKCDSAALAAGLAEKATAGNGAGKNAWFFLTCALNRAVFNENDVPINNIIALIQRCIEKCDSAALAAGLAEKATEIGR